MQQKTIQILSIALFVAILAWGVFSLLYYLGVPVHMAVLMQESDIQVAQAACAPDAVVCRGLYSLLPVITHTVRRAEPFLWYLLLSVVLYGCLVGWSALKHGTFMIRIRMTPWKLVLLFIGSLWLLFTVLSFGKEGDVSIRRVIEPLETVYVNAGPEALEALQGNFQALESAGCLRLEGQFTNGAKVYEMKTWCVQRSFVTRVLSVALVIFVLLFELLIAGRGMFSLFRFRVRDPLAECMLSAGMGVFVWIVLLWLMSVLRIYTMGAGWMLAMLIPSVFYKQTLYWIRRFLDSAWISDRPWYSVTYLLAWLLLSYLALNFLTVVRPFPIGWDDLGSYLNRPHLLVSYGRFIPTMSTFQWEFLTSLGFLLFGFDSTFGATSSMMINWTEGLLAVSFLFIFARRFLGTGAGILSAFLYYVLPLVGHFSFADMKIDNALFVMSVLAAYCLFHVLFLREDEDEDARWWLVLAGIFVGLGFGMKATGIMLAFALGAVLLGVLLHWTAVLAVICGAFAAFTRFGGLSFEKVAERLSLTATALTPDQFALGLVAIAVIIMAIVAYLHRSRIQKTAFSVSFYALGFLIAVLPWLSHNSFLNGSPGLHLGVPNTLTPQLNYSGTQEVPANPAITIRSLPPELGVDMSQCIGTGSNEELDRYWGNRKGWSHYLTLPWRTVMNVDSAGYYVTTMPALLLFALLLLLPYFWTPSGRWLRWLWFTSAFLILQWVFLANGILWYGLAMFLGLVVGLEALIVRAPDILSRSFVAGLLALSVVMDFGFRFWQFEQQRNLFEYPMGKVDAATLRERTIPHYDDITELVLERKESMPDRPYLYRVGTFIPYFIPKNLEVIARTDNQLDDFNCLYSDRDPEKFVARIKALGFNSIIFDTNTATIERDPNGTLHRKVNAFVELLNRTDLGFQVVINDSQAGVAFILLD